MSGIFINLTNGDDTVTPTSSSSALPFTTNSDDTVYGEDGNDFIDGGGGFDLLYGGRADDSLAGGNDTIWAGEGEDTIDGQGGNDLIRGGNLGDHMDGGAGNDTVDFSDMTGDMTISLAGEIALGDWVDYFTGFEAAIGGSGRDRIEDDAGNNTLAGMAGNDTLFALFGGNDQLDGGEGADSMRGGAGDDLYVVDDLLDMILEAFGNGTDRVMAGVDWTLGNHVEWLSLTGGAANGTGNADDNRLDGNGNDNLLAGGEGADSLFGGIGNDTLDGGDGADRLDGGAGADSMAGGLGDDTYFVRQALDSVVEAADGGRDRVFATVSHALGAELEWLSLLGNADIDGTGNAQNNRIDGAAGANLLDGGDGADTLNGLDGADTLLGDDGADRLTGGNGDDLLRGGLGADRLYGGDGADIFRYGSAAEGGDRITLYVGAEDVIEVSAAGFGGGLAEGGLDPARFVANTTGLATAAFGQFVWETDAQRLWWDADGTGAGARTMLALMTGATLTAAEITVIA